MAFSQIPEADNRSVTPTLSQTFYFAAWRWHFYAALYVIPFLLVLAITGLMMMVLTQIDGRDGENIHVTPGASELSVQAQTEAALAAQPGKLVEWIGPKGPDLATVFRIAPAEGGNRLVALDPYSGEVLKIWDRRAGWYDWADNVHRRRITAATSLACTVPQTGCPVWDASTAARIDSSSRNSPYMMPPGFRRIASRFAS